MSAHDPKWVAADWLAATLRNCIETDEHLCEIGVRVVQPPGDSQTIYVLQRGGNHLIVQVNPGEVVIG